MTSAYPNVFSPIRIGPVQIANRFFFSPHGLPLHILGAPTEDAVAYYAERAAGGCGLTIHSLPAYPANINHGACAFYEEAIPSFRAVADAVHEHGTKMFGQLHYWWSGYGAWSPLSPPKPTIGPSPLQHFETFAVTREASTALIGRLVESYVRSARHLRLAGYDGIEIHAAHGSMVEQFLSPYFNRRSDEYGGSLENRMRFVLEILSGVRAAVAEDMAVGIRFNCDEMLPGGFSQEGAREILARLVDLQLIDYANLDVAIEPNQFPLGMPPYHLPPNVYASFVNAVRDSVGAIPVISVMGRMTSIAEAERLLAAGAVDMVGAARGLIAEPDLMKHAREGREADSRVCIACNYCLESRNNWAAWGCAINPATAKERHWGTKTFQPAERSVSVVVVGAGIAGMEAARVAAKLGHQVTLFERGQQLGGQLNQWASLPGREVFATTPKWYERQLAQLGVDLRLGAEATAASVLAAKPDAVIVATGSRYTPRGESGFLALEIPGWEQDFVVTPEQILEGGARPRGKVIILDDEGLNTGPGIAQLLAELGAEVEIVTRWMQPVSNTLVYNFEFAFIMPILKNLGVKMTTQTYLKEIGDHEVTVFDVFTNEERTITNIDAVVLATMRMPQDQLVRDLDGRVAQLFVVGDASAPRMLAAAADEGQRFARMIGVEGMPRTFEDAYFSTIPAEAFPSRAVPSEVQV